MSAPALTRRRFLLAAAACALPAAARAATLLSGTQEWTGIALGAEVRIVLVGASPQQAARSFAKVQQTLAMVEAHFSLYRDSALTRLNRMGTLCHPAPAMLDVFHLADAVHKVTGGLFDPTIQPLWLAIATGAEEAQARTLLGWERVRFSEDEIALEPGMQLTFNGIAQGHAADAVARLLEREGYTDVLIDTGEIAGLGHRPDGAPWQAAIALPDGREVRRAALSNRALAVSSPVGTRIGGGKAHIVSPKGAAPLWQLVAVSAPQAALADALSTAFCLMERDAIAAALAQLPGARLEALV